MFIRLVLLVTVLVVPYYFVYGPTIFHYDDISAKPEYAHIIGRKYRTMSPATVRHAYIHETAFGEDSWSEYYEMLFSGPGIPYVAKRAGLISRTYIPVGVIVEIKQIITNDHWFFPWGTSTHYAVGVQCGDLATIDQEIWLCCGARLGEDPYDAWYIEGFEKDRIDINPVLMRQVEDDEPGVTDCPPALWKPSRQRLRQKLPDRPVRTLEKIPES